MDNCLASNSETGGVGCDNMTMIVIGLLYGKSKKEWYDLIGKRVADGDGPCAPPEYGKFSSCPRGQLFSDKSSQPSSGARASVINSITTALTNTN